MIDWKITYILTIGVRYIINDVILVWQIMSGEIADSVIF